MRMYTRSDMDKFFKSPYAVLRIDENGMYIYHTLNDNSLTICCPRSDVAEIWKLMENGGERGEYEEILGRSQNGGTFLRLIEMGLIE